MYMGGTLKDEISRTADEVERISKERDIFFVVAYLKDIEYVGDPKRYKLFMSELEDRLKAKIKKNN